MQTLQRKRKEFYLLKLVILVLIGFLFSCSLFSQDIRFPNVPVYENKNLVPYKIKEKDYKKFKNLVKRFYFSMPAISYQGKDFSIYLLNLEEIKILEKSNLTYESFSKSAPFKYYDKGYSFRRKYKFTNLKDLQSGYKNQWQNEIYLKAIAEKFPDKVSYFELGKTRLGKTIPALKITSPKPSSYKIPVLFTGSHHGNELISTEHCYDIIFNLLNDYNKYEPYLESIVVWIVPIVNPDGSYFFWNRTIDMGRKNGYLPAGMKKNNITRGVDLNRNYPYKWNTGYKTASSGIIESHYYRGISPASEPETKAMIRLANRERFLFSMSFHSFATAILFPYTIENTTNPEPDYVKDLATRIIQFAKSVRLKRNYQVRKNLYPVDGTDQDYYYNEFGTNAFILEASHQNVEYEIVGSILQGFKGTWENLLYEFFKGNKVILKVGDEQGKPLSASIKIDEIEYFENEKFTSHPETGVYAKMFLEEKEYTFSLQKQGYKSERIIIKAGKSLNPHLIKLKKL